jgi:phospholipid transport system substrate-binding protein
MDRLPLRPARRALLVMAVAALVPLLTVRVAASAEPATAAAEALVRELAESAWTLLHRSDLDRRRRLDELVGLLEGKTDVALLARLALGRHWQRLSPQQQDRYEQLFSEVVMGSLARRLDQYVSGADGTLDQHLQFLTSQPAGKDDVLVRTRVRTQQGDVVSVDWRLRGREQPVILDLVIEGASLLLTQRSEFATVIERSDVDGLLAELSARAGSADS